MPGHSGNTHRASPESDSKSRTEVTKILLRIFLSTRRRIGSKQDPILILFEKSASRRWLAPQFANTRSDIHRHIRETIEAGRHMPQILRKIAEMKGDELRLRMPCKESVACCQQLRVRREILAIERPVRMIVQFFVALVEPVNRPEKCHGV